MYLATFRLHTASLHEIDWLRETLSRSRNTQKQNLANIQPSWPHTWSITHIYHMKHTGKSRSDFVTSYNDRKLVLSRDILNLNSPVSESRPHNKKTHLDTVKTRSQWRHNDLRTLCRYADRVCALSRNKKIKSKTIQWIKSRNCNIIDNK